MVVTISIQRSASRRFSTTMRIINVGEIELRAPTRLSDNALIAFVENNTPFLAKSLTIPHQSGLPKQLSPGMDIYLYGKEFLLDIVSTKGPKIEVDYANKAIQIHKRGGKVSKKQFYDLITPELENYVLNRALVLAPTNVIYTV